MTWTNLPPRCASPNQGPPASPAFSDTPSQTSTKLTPTYPLLPHQLHGDVATSSSERTIHQTLPETNRDIVALSVHDPYEGRCHEDGLSNQESIREPEEEEYYYQNTDQELTRNQGLVFFASSSGPSPRIYISASRAQNLEFRLSDQSTCHTPALQDEDTLPSPSPGCTSDSLCPTLSLGEGTVTAENAEALAVSEQDRIEERNRKGRERSLRTRHRNANRLRLLQENCWYLCRENEMLREILRIWEQNKQWGAVLQDLFEKLAELRETRPEPYVPGGV